MDVNLYINFDTLEPQYKTHADWEGGKTKTLYEENSEYDPILKTDYWADYCLVGNLYLRKKKSPF